MLKWLKCLWLIRSQCSPNGKRYENLRTRHEIQNAILFWTHVVKCIPFVLWAFQFPTVCRACSHYLFLSSSQTFEMCYLDKICLLFGYVYYLVIFHNEDIWVRSSGPVVSPTKAPMGAKNSGQIRCGKKNSWSHLFFFGGGGVVGVNLRWNIHRYIRSVKGEESNILTELFVSRVFLTFSRTLPYLQKSFQKVHPNNKVKPLAAWEVQPGWVEVAKFQWLNSIFKKTHL